MTVLQVRFITRKWAPAVGGMETYCLRLSERLASSTELEVIALAGRSNGRAPGALALIAFGLSTAIKLLFARRAHVVHVADVASWPLAWIAHTRHPTSRLVMSAHGSDLSYATRKGWRPFFYSCYLALGARLLPHVTVIANSYWISGLARQAGFADTRVVPLATDLAPTQPSTSHSAILFAGRICLGKGLRFLIEEVLPLLAPDQRLRVAGTLCEESEKLLLEHSQVDYLGALAPGDLASEYASARLVAIPSQLPEGFGLVAIEAAACGGIVVAANHSGLAEAVTPLTGFLVPRSDPSAWSSMIREIASWSSTRRDTFIAQATSEARRIFSWDRVAAHTIDIYRHLPSGSAP